MQLANRGNRQLWTVLGLLLLAVIAFGVMSSQALSGGSHAAPASPSPAAASATAAASESPAGAQNGQNLAGSPAAKPFLADYQDPQAQPEPNGFLTVLGLLIKLAFVVGLIYLSILGLRHFTQRGRAAFLGGSAINVIEKTPLAQNRELYLIDVADKVLLLGATGSSIALLTEITDAAAIEELRNKPQPSLPSAEPFLAYLKRLTQVGPRGQGPEPVEVLLAEASERDGQQSPAAPLPLSDFLERIEHHKQRIQASAMALSEVEQ